MPFIVNLQMEFEQRVAHSWQEIGKSFKAANMDLLATDEAYIVPLTSEK